MGLGPFRLGRVKLGLFGLGLFEFDRVGLGMKARSLKADPRESIFRRSSRRFSCFRHFPRFPGLFGFPGFPVARPLATAGLLLVVGSLLSCSAPHSTQPATTTSVGAESTSPGPVGTEPVGTAPAGTEPAAVGSASASEVSAAGSPSASLLTQTLNCDNPIDQAATANDLVAGPVALNVMALGSEPGKVIPLGEDSDRQGFHFAKIGLAIHTGLSFELSVEPSWRGQALIGWSNSGTAPTQVEKIPACQPGAAGAEWIVFPGGFWVTEPACLPLRVTTATESVTLSIPIGRTCPPQ